MRYTLTKLLAAVMCVSFTGAANAQHMNAPDGPCREAVATSDMVRCLDRALKDADAKLNSTYGRIQKILGPKESQKLTRAQRLWIEFRDATCDAERELYGGGTAGPPAYLACLESQTRLRESDLMATYGWRLQK